MIIGADDWDGKFDPDNDIALISASSLDNVSAKPALEAWKRKNIADFVVSNADVMKEWLDDYGEDQFTKIIAGAQYPTLADGLLQQNQIGTVTHAYAEAKATSAELEWPSDCPDTPEARAQVKPFMTQVDRFFDEWVQHTTAVERVVFDPDAGVAGRFDAKLLLNTGEDALIDFKSADRPKQVYGQSHALQLAAYRYAPLQATFTPRTMSSDGNRYYLLNQAERGACVEPDLVDATYVVQITPESYEVWPIRTDGQVHRFVRAYASMHRWVSGVSATVVGEPLT